MTEVREVLFKADTRKVGIIAAGGTVSELVAGSSAEIATLRHRGTLETGQAFNWFEIINNDNVELELRPDSSTAITYTIPAKSIRRSDDFGEVITFFNLEVVNLDAANATVANKITINRRLVLWA